MSIALDLSKEKLAAIDEEIQGKVGNLVVERDQLMKDIKKLERGSDSNGNSAPATSDDDLLKAGAAAQKAKGDAVTSSEIAAHLGVDSRSIARRLSSFAGEGKIGGSKDTGYTF